ncbi:MAG: hotdog fold thioesterase [Bacteroidetes bacterium]|nr:MAG: hotdog fold thioesterase [Bacteroidota bacterium]
MADSVELPGAVFEKMMEKDYCSQWMQLQAVSIAEGYCRLRMQVRQEMLNGYGMLHGGIAFAFADSAFAFASNSYGRVAVSINASMHYARSAYEGDILFAEAKALNVSYKTADFDVNIMDETGLIYYYFRGTVYRTSKEVLAQ